MNHVLKFFKNTFALVIKSETATTAGRLNAFGMVICSVILLLSATDGILKTIINTFLIAFGKPELPSFSPLDILAGIFIIGLLTISCVFVVQPEKSHKNSN